MLLRISKEVKEALNNNKPVVALETTIISHGMPYPDNIKTALEVERIIRENGAVPATIGIIDGVGVVGMNEEEILEAYRDKLYEPGEQPLSAFLENAANVIRVMLKEINKD